MVCTRSVPVCPRATRHGGRCTPLQGSVKGGASVSIAEVDPQARPIYHQLEKRVRAHIFLRMLAYYVEWHIEQAWRELLFSDEQKEQDRGICGWSVAPV